MVSMETDLNVMEKWSEYPLQEVTILDGLVSSALSEAKEWFIEKTVCARNRYFDLNLSSCISPVTASV